MRTYRARLGALAAVAGIAVPAAITGTSPVASAAGTSGSATAAAVTVEHLTLGATVHAVASAAGSAAVAHTEVPAAAGGPNRNTAMRIAGSTAAATTGVAVSSSNAGLTQSFDGIDHFQQRTANGGNQFSLEPPDQGLCASSTAEFESVNAAVRTYDRSGHPTEGVITLNQFYGWAPNINRTTGKFGPFVFDPTCIYDAPTGRFFQLVNSTFTDPSTGAFTGPNELTLAVSKTSDPTGPWYIYHLPAQDDGTQGTPNHHCTGGPCFADFPHIGADANGIYLTTNEYDFFGPNFHGAQIYSASKEALADGSKSVTVYQFDTHTAGPHGQPGFTVWPATSPGTDQFSSQAGGTEYFLSSNAAVETGNTHGQSNQLIVWAESNTRSLRTGRGMPHLSNTVLKADPYYEPPHSFQRQGPAPLMLCLDDGSRPTPYGRGCWRDLGLSGGPFLETEQSLDSSDTRMLTVTYVDGQLIGALDTALLIRGQSLAGFEAFDAVPHMTTSGVAATLRHNGYYGAPGLDTIYPAIGIAANGRGTVGFTVVGKGMYPSAGYAILDLNRGFGSLQIARAGAGPQDGFSGYYVYNAPGNERPRWGDYGAASVVGNQVWIANEYIGQSCTLTQYMRNTAASPFGTCNDTRTALANWDTRISLITP